MSKYVPPHKKMASDPGSDRFQDTPRDWNADQNPFQRSFHRGQRDQDYGRQDYGRQDYGKYGRQDYGKYGRQEQPQQAQQAQQAQQDGKPRQIFQSEDFPSLKPKLFLAVTDPQSDTQSDQPDSKPKRPTFAQLASEWTKKLQEQQAKEEEEAKALEEAAKKNRERKEKEERERIRALSMGLSRVDVNRKPDSDDDKECDIGCHVSHG